MTRRRGHALPEEVPFTLAESRRRPGGLAVIAAALAAVGVSMILDGNALGWLLAVFFGAATLVLAAMTLHPPQLQVTEEGLTAGSLFSRPVEMRWHHIDEFVTIRLPYRGGTMVGVRYSEDGTRELPAPAGGSRSTALSHSLTGADAALPATSGLGADTDDLVALLNRLLAERRTAG
ncbi:hypothetical protein [Haloechinothrix sp. LS1_15]|uniref:hypothetical protein n=1 Tax=Haloechinothrix sp. LS1_15 TaxID=2652248 RepID=UPI002945C4AD|nr:hypothetical protein [Haloechinothrix sp. LS1_15]MDV6012556.1 hypothetical protein [Haloechinothrix sp. LS1_15]